MAHILKKLMMASLLVVSCAQAGESTFQRFSAKIQRFMTWNGHQGAADNDSAGNDGSQGSGGSIIQDRGQGQGVPGGGTAVVVNTQTDRVALERERTRQLEIQVGAELKKDHERGKWTATIVQHAIAAIAEKLNVVNTQIDRVALERERTRQLEIQAEAELKKDHERGRWTATIIETIAEKLNNDDPAALAAKLDNDLKKTQMALSHKLENDELARDHEKHTWKHHGEMTESAQNHDREMATRAQQHEMSKLKFVGNGIRRFTEDPSRIAQAAWGFSTLALGIYAAKRGTKVAADYLAARLMQPALVSETSHKSILERLRHPIKSRIKTELPTAYYNADLQKQVDDYVESVKYRKKMGQPFRNALLHGDPGTGKTLIAKTIATQLGLPYAVIPGANIGQYSGEESIKQMNRLLDWGAVNNAVLFFDEADAWAQDRGSATMSEKMLGIQNTFYGRTGTGAEKFLLLAATNQSKKLDPAFRSRMGAWLKFTSPDEGTRVNLLNLYLNKDAQKFGVNTQGIGESHIASVAKTIAGYAGRDIQDLARTVHDSVSLTQDKVITSEMLASVAAQHVKQRRELNENNV